MLRVGPVFTSGTGYYLVSEEYARFDHAEDCTREIEGPDGTASLSPTHFISSKIGCSVALAFDCSSVSSAS